MVRRTTELRQIARRMIGRQRIRWEDDVRADLGEMKVQNWSKMAMDTEGWKKMVDQPQTHREEETGSTLKHKIPHNILLKV
jgi:hypothetical protein